MVLKRLVAALREGKLVLARLLLLFVIFSFCAVASIAALDPTRHMSQYAHTAWRVQDGFEVGTTIAQTPDGYLWFGTSTALFRFDGVRFTPYELPPIDPPVRGFNYLLAGRDGSLWIGTPRGLARLKDGKLQWFSDTAQNSGVSAILEDPKGTIWLTRYRVPKGEGPLCRVEGSGLHCYGEADGIRVRYGLGLTWDGGGNLWFGSSVLSKWRPGWPATTYLEQINKRPDAGEGIVDVAAGLGGTIWATTQVAGPGMGVLWFSNGKWSNYVVPGFDGSTVGSQTLFMDREHTLWIGTTADGLYRVHDRVAEHYSTADGLSGRDINLIFEDHEGNIWVVTDGGIDMFRDTAVVCYTEREGLTANSVYSVLALRDGSLWIANANTIDILKDGRHSALPAKGRFDQRVRALFEDPHGVLWLGRENRLFSYAHGVYREVKDLDGSILEYGPISAITGGADGNIWVLTERHNLLRVANGHATKVLKTSDSNRFGGGLGPDHNGGLWIASRTDTFTYYKDGDVRTISLHHPESSFNVNDISVDSDDALIVSSSLGLFRWDGKLWRGLDTRDGLPGNTVYSFLRDNDNAVWIRCQRGLVQISESEFEKWSRSGNKPMMMVFGQLDGARPDGLPFMMQPSAARTADGRLWFAANTILQMIDPKQTFRNQIPPPVYVEKIVADRKEYRVTEGLKLPAQTRDVEIDYTALSMMVPQKVSFRYRLENHDAEWQDAGTRRQVFYNDLPPGNYRFRVIASNNSGVWNEAGASFAFSVVPAYYQTSWFHALAFAVLLGLLWALYQFRLRQIQAKLHAGFEARVDERTRIARELHDTLLQNLHGLMFQFQAARNMLPKRPDEARNTLDVAIGATEQTITESEDAIRDLRSEQCRDSDLVQSLTSIAQELSASETISHTAPAFRMTEEGERQDLAAILQNEVYRIGREVLRNAFKHAAATRIEAEVRYDCREFRLRIRDDGKGIDPQILAEGGRPGHWGLPGIRERARRIRANLDFWSAPGAGTEVQLRAPAEVAYKKKPNNGAFEVFGRGKNHEHGSQSDSHSNS